MAFRVCPLDFQELGEDLCSGSHWSSAVGSVTSADASETLAEVHVLVPTVNCTKFPPWKDYLIEQRQGSRAREAQAMQLWV